MTMTYSDAVSSYIEDVKAKAFDDGRRSANSIDLGDSSYGAVRTSVVAVEFTSFLELRRRIRGNRYSRRGDNPGQAYLWTCDLIHIHHGDDSKVALLRCSTCYDI